MKSIFLTILLQIAVNCFSQDFHDKSFFEDHVLLNKKLPTFSAETLSGKPVNLSDTSKVIVINFWYLSCTSCYKEIPELNIIAERFAKDGVLVISLMADPKDEILKRIEPSGKFYQLKKEVFNNKAIDYEIIPDANVIFKTLFEMEDKQGFPQTFVVDRSGIIRAYSYTYFSSINNPTPHESENYKVLETMVLHAIKN